jgi:ubiquinone/menaquinone biosynthesis C-methylase UbiE
VTGLKGFQGERIFLQHYDIEKEDKLPYGNNYFDVVTMLAVFEHIDPLHIVSMLKEVYRIMKPRGQYILTTPAAWADILLRTLARFGLVSREEIDEHKAKYTHIEISALLIKAGFNAVNIKHGYFEAFVNLWVSASK